MDKVVIIFLFVVGWMIANGAPIALGWIIGLTSKQLKDKGVRAEFRYYIAKLGILLVFAIGALVWNRVRPEQITGSLKAFDEAAKNYEYATLLSSPVIYVGLCFLTLAHTALKLVEVIDVMITDNKFKSNHVLKAHQFKCVKCDSQYEIKLIARPENQTNT